MKRIFACLLAAVLLLACVGCGGKKTETAEEKTLTGTLDEVKDFMFVVTDQDGVSYALSFEEKPEGLADVSVGDSVTVTYTGELSEIDPFTGTILRAHPSAIARGFEEAMDALRKLDDRK